MSRRAMRGSWDRIFPSVYRLPGATRTGRQRAMAAILWSGDGSAISHTTAARLLRYEAIRSDALHVTVPRSSGLHRDDLVVHRTGSPPSRDLVVVDGIRCTSATRTIVDCAAILDDEVLETAFEHARRMGLTSPAALARCSDKLCGRGRPGSARLRRLLAVQAAGERPLESRLEVKLARLLRKSALPAPVRQYPVGRFRLDFAWPTMRVACECDGFEHHGARLAWKRDRRRLAAIEAAGWRIVHVTWDDVTCAASQTLDRLARAVREAA